MERTGEVLWVTDHMDDLDADFRVFYRVEGIGEEDFGGMTGPRFFALAERTFAYEGVMAARQAAEQAERSPSSPTAARPDVREVPSDQAALKMDPVLSGLIDF
jgi:hypothetical protein